VNVRVLGSSKALSVALSWLLLAASSFAGPPAPEALEKEIAEARSRVAEFAFVRKEAQKLGLRAWLFGGTAAGFAHYVNWDLKRKSGDPRYQADRFDYDFTNIYRSTQDLDIVVDGPPEKARQLKAIISSRFPHFLGSKEDKWEIRLLRQASGEGFGEKDALLDNPDYLNQHTDSNSTGMVELTDPPAGEPVTRDLRDWKSKRPIFFEDVRLGKLHYYFSDKHHQTKRFKGGFNPPIFSAIRYLTKAFQYDLEITPEDMKKIREIAEDFHPIKNGLSPEVQRWIEKNAKKLIQNAVNIEYAVKTLDQLGLRRKLAKVNNDPDTYDSLAWWMDKQPLETFPLGQGPGKGAVGRTARELGIKIVAHETRTFLSYESITRAHTGDPNVLISRENHGRGEAAVYGDGFYTRIGKIGAAGTGLTIRFQLHPDAREGRDFTLHGDFVLVKNKAALKVIQESLNLTPLQYFQFIDSGNSFDHSDRGIFEKLKRSYALKSSNLTPQEETEIAALVRTAMERPIHHAGDIPRRQRLLEAWRELPASKRHPSVEAAATHAEDSYFRSLIESPPKTENGWASVRSVFLALSQAAHARVTPELIDRLIGTDRRYVDYVEEYVLRSDHWPANPKWFKAAYKDSSNKFYLLAQVLGKSHWSDHLYLAEDLLASLDPKSMDAFVAAKAISKYVLSNPSSSRRGPLLRLTYNILKAHPEKSEPFSDLFNAMRMKEWTTNSEWLPIMQELIRLPGEGRNLAYLFSKPYWQKRDPWLLEQYLSLNPKENAKWVAQAVSALAKQHQVRLDRVVDQLWKQIPEEDWYKLISEVPEWSTNEAWIDRALRTGEKRETLAKLILVKPGWNQRPEILRRFVEEGQLNLEVAAKILLEGQYESHPELAHLLIDLGGAEIVGKNLLRKEPWIRNLGLVERVLRITSRFHHGTGMYETGDQIAYSAKKAKIPEVEEMRARIRDGRPPLTPEGSRLEKVGLIVRWQGEYYGTVTARYRSHWTKLSHEEVKSIALPEMTRIHSDRRHIEVREGQGWRTLKLEPPNALMRIQKVATDGEGMVWVETWEGPVRKLFVVDPKSPRWETPYALSLSSSWVVHPQYSNALIKTPLKPHFEQLFYYKERRSFSLSEYPFEPDILDSDVRYDRTKAYEIEAIASAHDRESMQKIAKRSNILGTCLKRHLKDLLPPEY